MTDNEEEFKKKIKEALNREDKQKSIEVFLIISILIFAILIALGVLYNYNFRYKGRQTKYCFNMLFCNVKNYL